MVSSLPDIKILQKNIFLLSEADAWYERNHRATLEIDYAADPVAIATLECSKLTDSYVKAQKPRILEIGCGEGRRLAWIAEKLDAEVIGVEPSSLAVEQASIMGIEARLGTADSLPFDNAAFDIVIFGFCLYLCDRQDLFRIAQEADRVLKPESWLIINDFYSKTHSKRAYQHKKGVNTYKMDYREMFNWHPAFTCYDHRLAHHGKNGLTDDPEEWVATSIMRKKNYS